MENMRTIFEKFDSLTVLVVGDVMIDRYLSGRVNRISPEAPVPVVSLTDVENRLGGAANVALNIQAMGARAILLSVLGTDENSHTFKDLLKKNNLPIIGIQESSSRKTTVKTRILSSNQQLLRVDSEDTHDLTANELESLLATFQKIVLQFPIDAILFQDYNKGVLSREVIDALLQEARMRGIPTTVDPKKANFWAYQGVTLFKPNLKEIRESVPFPVLPSLASLKPVADYIRQKLNNKLTLVTLSEKGVFYEGDGQAAIVPTTPRSIADVSGAGDTVISVATLALAAGLDLPAISRLSNLAGGQVCEKVGVVPVDKGQLLAEAANLISANI